MLTRRELLIGGAMATAAGMLRGTTTLRAKAAQPATKVNFDVPAGACDCHVHVFGDPQRYPLFAGRTYTPETALVSEVRALLTALHMDRVVVVQPSVYGTDNTCTLDAIRDLGAQARGIAVIDASTTDAALDQMARAGIRGVRLNLSTGGTSDPVEALRRFQAVTGRAKARNWHVQFNTTLPMIEALGPQLLASPVTIVIDHFGGAVGARGVEQPGFGTLVNLVKAGKAYVKISAAADNVSKLAPNYPDVAPLARALVSANPQRILWGTGWPHPGGTAGAGRKSTDISPLAQTDDGLVLNLLPAWVPDPITRKTILVDNPARLFGF
jgi:predicted TIM-barrel fold metal-dependent hydrolase